MLSRNLDNILRPLLASRSCCILNGLLFMSAWRRRGGAQNAFSHLCEGTMVRTTGFAMINSAICDFSFCSITENTAFNPACSTAYGIAVIFVISSLSAHRYPSTRYAYLYLHLTFYSFVFCLGETNECSGRVGDDKNKFFFFSYLVHDFAKMG